MNFEVVGHWRSGNNLLRFLLLRNFDTAARNFRHFIVNHLPPWRYGPKCIGVVRHVVPTLFSHWRTRTRNGMHESLSFQDFLRTPYDKMPRIRYTPDNIVVNGVGNQHANMRAVRELWMTPPQFWLYCSKHAIRCSACHFWYEDLVFNPIQVVVTIADVTGVPRRPVFKPVASKVGVWPVEEEVIHYTEEDLVLMLRYQHRFDRWYPEHWNDAKYPYDVTHYRWARKLWTGRVRRWRVDVWQRRRRLRRLAACRGQLISHRRIEMVN